MICSSLNRLFFIRSAPSLLAAELYFSHVQVSGVRSGNIYGVGYIGHPRLPKLMEKNNISSLGFIPGDEEPKAFEAGDYVGVHRSTLRKVDAFESILTRAAAGTLKTNYRWRDIYGKSPKDVVLFLKEHWIYTLITMLMLCIGVGKLIYHLGGGKAP